MSNDTATEQTATNRWVRQVQDAYLDGTLTLEEFEAALEDRLAGPPYKHLSHFTDKIASPTRMIR